ncbi:MAG: hypothetical protein JKY93_03390 [Gammaproteobacteria bacterium]|nr:hypothetical protein [Gammaproteobacteria bacterium]
MPQALVFLFPTAFSAGASAALVTAAGTLTTLGTAVSLGASLALSAALSPKLGNEQSASMTISVNTAQSKAPRIIHYGRVMTAGSFNFADAKDGALTRLIIHGHGLADGIEAYYLDGTEMLLDESGFVTNDQFQIGDTSYVQILSRMGMVPSPYYPEIEADFEAWDDTHRADGLCTSMLRTKAPTQSKINAMYPNRELNLKVLLRGRLLKDPRSGETAWTANLALCIRDFLTSPDGFNIAEDAIDDSYFKIAADICDIDRPLLEGGTEKQFEFHGSASLNESKMDMLDRMTSSGAVDVFLTANGKVAIEMGSWYEPSFTLTDDMLLDYEYVTGQDVVDGFNTLNLKFIDPAAEYASVDANPWLNEAELLESGEVAQEANIYTHSHAQARAVGKNLTDRLNPKSILKVTCKPVGLQGFFDTRWRVEISGVSGVFLVVSKTLNPKSLVTSYELREIQEDAATLSLEEQGVKPAVATVVDNFGVPLISNFGAYGYGGGIGCAWEPSVNVSLSVQLEFSGAGLDQWQSVSLADGDVFAQISATVGDLYDVRIAWVTSGGTVGEFTILTDILAASGTEIPAAPTELTALVGSYSADVAVSLVSSASDNSWSTEIYRDGDLVHASYAIASSAISFVDTVSDGGTYTYTALSRNIAGEASAVVGTSPETITIQF